MWDRAGIDEYVFRPHIKPFDCPLHGQKARMVDVEFVDFCRLGEACGPAYGVLLDLACQ
jgi:hypothetical protein